MEVNQRNLGSNLSLIADWAHADSADLLANVTYSYHIDECCFSGVLKSHQCQLHLLFPKEGPEPVQKPIYERQHLGWHSCRYSRLYMNCLAVYTGSS